MDFPKQIKIKISLLKGKYFCRSCHSDKRSYLPSYIITKWDFSCKHSVSNFAYDYLNRIYNEPSFNLNDLNPKLFDKVKPLRIVNEHRWILYYIRHYILTCRFAAEKEYEEFSFSFSSFFSHSNEFSYQQMLQKLSTYMYTNPQIYSLHDLFKVNTYF